jgi:hypothetical protein
MSGYAEQYTAAAFDRSRECFEQIVAGLAGEDAGRATHAELEEQLSGQGRDLLRQLLQDHLDLRALREQPHPQVAGADGVTRTRLETGHTRGLATIFGTVTLTRIAYRAPGVPNLHPADARLSLPAGKHSYGLARLAALEAARGSFTDATSAVARSTGVHIGNRQMEELAQAAALDVEAFYTRQHRRAAPGRLLVMQFDGKGIVMVPSALRESTAKAAARDQQKLSTRLSPGEKHGHKRMAELAVVFDADPAPRQPADIISRGSPTRQPGPAATSKWLAASVVEDISQVIAAGFDEATRRDPHHQRTWIALVDGNNTQIQAIQDQATCHRATVHILIDFIHVLEYVWKAAWSFFYTGDHAAETWVAEQATKILQGRAAQVAAGIRRRATRYGYNPKERAGADTCATYLTNKAPYLDYPTALTQGWPIATGAIEGACRHLVKDRMDITGARWGLATAEAILRLRAVSTNGDFDAYWAYHLRQQHQRIHANHYLRRRQDYTLTA